MSKKERNPDARWFVEPLNPPSNEMIMNYLITLCQSYPDIEHIKVADAEVVFHNVIEVSYREMLYLVKCRKSQPECKFRVWNITRFGAPLRDCEYLFAKKSIRQSAEFKRLQKNIKPRTKTNDSEPF